jgi:hypothetical protein
MGTDWLIKVRCPYPNKDIRTEEERINACLRCPYVIWQEPEPVAGFMSSMCGVRVGSIGMAAELDDIGKKLTGIPEFTKQESSPSQKLEILEKIKEHTNENGWSILGLPLKATLEHLDTLIEFCKRAKEKGLRIYAWA